MLRLLALTLTLIYSQHSHSHIFPSNDLRIPIESINSGLNEKEFNQSIEKVEVIYRPIIEKEGVTLKINRLWKDEKVNASTTRTTTGNTWIINLYGGLARHPEITEDALQLVICHEIGHHLGGSPKKTRGTPPVQYWASTEGQSDYFATSECLRKIFEKDDNERLVRSMNIIPIEVKSKCAISFKDSNDYSICIRTIMAGAAVARMGAAIKFQRLPHVGNRDSRVVENVIEGHPTSQCRLDTYFDGSICNRDLDNSTCERPLCWFRPQKRPE